jgi:hypothetical protein
MRGARFEQRHDPPMADVHKMAHRSLSIEPQESETLARRKIGTKLVRTRRRCWLSSHEKTPPERGFFA